MTQKDDADLIARLRAAAPLAANGHILTEAADALSRAALDASAEPVATVVACEPYEDGSPNPNVYLDWTLRDAENSLSVGTKLFTRPAASKHQGAESGRAVLSDEEILDIANEGRDRRSVSGPVDYISFARALLAAQPQQPDSEAPTDNALQSLLDDVTAIDTWYRGSPSYEHDAGWFKDRVVRLIEQRIGDLK